MAAVTPPILADTPPADSPPIHDLALSTATTPAGGDAPADAPADTPDALDGSTGNSSDEDALPARRLSDYGVRIERIRALRGPNLYAYFPVLRITLDA